MNWNKKAEKANKVTLCGCRRFFQAFFLLLFFLIITPGTAHATNGTYAGSGSGFNGIINYLSSTLTAPIIYDETVSPTSGGAIFPTGPANPNYNIPVTTFDPLMFGASVSYDLTDSIGTPIQHYDLFADVINGSLNVLGQIFWPDPSDGVAGVNYWRYTVVLYINGAPVASQVVCGAFAFGCTFTFFNFNLNSYAALMTGSATVCIGVTSREYTYDFLGLAWNQTTTIPEYRSCHTIVAGTPPIPPPPPPPPPGGGGGGGGAPSYTPLNYVLGLMKMTEQFSLVMVHQVFAIGTMLDAKHQLETMALLDKMTAQAQSTYQPSEKMCVIGTNVRSLAASERKSEINAYELNRIMLDRERLMADSSAYMGGTSDKEYRLEQFRNTYCDVRDNNYGLQNICQPGPKRPNYDINYTGTVDTRLTLDIDFTDTLITTDEEDVIALSKNLFSHKLFDKVPEEITHFETFPDNYQDMRSLTAIRGVARNSYAHLIGMKAHGTPESAPFIKSFAQQLGIPPGELDLYVGGDSDGSGNDGYPSYFAQMEFLTKKFFQTPEFYTSLYTTPANVERTKVALSALKIMQNRDRYEATLRREMLLAMLIELKLRTEEKKVRNEILGNVTTQFMDPQ